METKPNSPAELNKIITSYINDLARETDQAKISEVLQKYLAFCASFHSYSLNNQFLIFLFRSNATLVAGYHDWTRKHRFVKKGEKGIPILAPIPIMEEDENGNKKVREMRFKTVYVFDIAQTDGEPLPETPDWISPAKYPELETMLINYAHSLHIKVDFEDLSEIGAQGYSKKGQIVLDPMAGTKTLIHEIAHELLHHTKEARLKTRAEIELEAEAIAYVVARALEIKDLKSPNYLTIWDADGSKILDRLDLIRDTAHQILAAIFPVK